MDQNGDGIINERDLVYGKNPAPKAILGFSSNLSYGKASLAFTVRSNIGGYVYNNVAAGQNNYYGLNTTLGYSANVVPVHLRHRLQKRAALQRPQPGKMARSCACKT